MHFPFRYWLLFFGLHFSVTFTTPKEILGYDPDVSTIQPAHVTNKTPVITVLGFPDPAGMYRGKFDTPKTFTVTFSFYNTLLRKPWAHPLEVFEAIRSINLGQEADARALLYVVLECYKKGYDKVHIFANSRGGAATLSMLDMVINPQLYEKTWQCLGVTDKRVQEKIGAMLSRGTLFLAHPLMDYSATLAKTFSSFFDIVLPFPGTSGVKKTGAFCVAALLQMCTSFESTYPSPLEIVTRAILQKKWPFSLTIALADHDAFVGNEHERALQILASLESENLHIIKGGTWHTDIRGLVTLYRVFLMSTDHI